jgi:hypothetical protein
MNEFGTIDGGVQGDQTGKEVEIRLWYEKGWVYYIECLEEKMADAAATFAEKMALDADFGYSQDDRWTAWDSIKQNGYRIEGAHGDVDCASLVVIVYMLAGLKVRATGYTGSLKGILEATGKFKVYTDANHVSSCDYAKRGSIYLRPKTADEGGHVFIMLDNGARAASSTVENIGKPHVYIAGKANVRTGGTTNFKSIGIARVGEKYKYLGKADSGWYKIDFKGTAAFISNKTTLTRLVT